MGPLVFHPILKRICWGGRRLGGLLGKPIGPEADYAESWEIADHGDDQSIVSAGEFEGKTLRRLVERQNLPLFGRHACLDHFPLLVKFLDAHRVLSVQVHPDDRLAKEHEPSARGKSEAWVVLEADPGSELFLGLQSGVTKADLRRALSEGTVVSLLNRVKVRAGDCVYVPAGTVHAIGGGVLLAEIQQSSNLSYRLFDWGRVGSDGHPRTLHVEQALRCIDFDRGPVSPLVPKMLDGDGSLEELVRSPYFLLHRRRTDQPFALPPNDSCRVLMTLSGNGRLTCEKQSIQLSRGQCMLLPAQRPEARIQTDGELTLLEVSLP